MDGRALSGGERLRGAHRRGAGAAKILALLANAARERTNRHLSPRVDEPRHPGSTAGGDRRPGARRANSSDRAVRKSAHGRWHRRAEVLAPFVAQSAQKTARRRRQTSRHGVGSDQGGSPALSSLRPRPGNGRGSSPAYEHRHGTVECHRERRLTLPGRHRGADPDPDTYEATGRAPPQERRTRSAKAGHSKPAHRSRSGRSQPQAREGRVRAPTPPQLGKARQAESQGSPPRSDRGAGLRRVGRRGERGRHSPAHEGNGRRSLPGRACRRSCRGRARPITTSGAF